MRHLFFSFLLLFFMNALFSQNANDLVKIVNQHPGVYLDVIVDTKEEVQLLMNDFSIERGDVQKRGTQYHLKIWMTKVYIDKFLEKNISYQIDPSSLSLSESKPALTMATTVDQMASWNRYPTYSVYLQMMSNFQANFPELCKIDTILAITPLNHSILAARISTTLDQHQNKPAFLYSACIHGDEICGYVIMLRLIDYCLNNPSDSIVQKILNHVDLYICPLENPDGTFPISNTSISGSVRSNALGYDLNRSYPFAGYPTQPNVTISEINSMLNFISEKNIMMSANFHGGAELYNYAWDSWTTSQRQHPDRDWWIHIGYNFLDTIQSYAPSTYFDDEGGVTNGGDWYVITGSKLDCLNYYQQCRDVTIEISLQKQTNSTNLPLYWNYLNRSLLHYIYESSLGITGQITDSVTQEPLEALVFISGHDNNQSSVISFMSSGNYYRPIKSGTYTITYSAPGYQSKTIQVSILDGERVNQDISLVPVNYNVLALEIDQLVTVYPNPALDCLKIDFGNEEISIKTVTMISSKGQIVFSDKSNEPSILLDIQKYAKGVYFIKIDLRGETLVKKVILN